ncbi:type 4a pilus biogenesis protein PilO [Clostridium intestinale]|uniref:Fimbrial assembly protein PilO n=1 Tax=Clostridium intestinale URNW TaxID=1294142 RepID=U2NTQ9_9CLOT|nr:type 4a pilus biogenesis protein PilO [Clostridium intestinale]ERK32256.1 fimbrial assembly protein PilO [Clostridium intestinale URNW]
MKNISLGLDKLSHKEKILLLTVGILAVFFVYYNYFILPTTDKLTLLESEVETLRNQNLSYENIEGNIVIKEKEYNELKNRYDESAKALPKVDRYPELSKDLNELVNKNSILLANITMLKGQVYQQEQNPQEITTTEALNTQQVTLSLRGQFTSILNFVNDLENGVRVCEINSISSLKDDTTIQVTFYYAPGDMEESYYFNSGTYGKDNMFN